MRVTSYPKSKINILLLENIHANARAHFEHNGYNHITSLNHALDETELVEALQNVHLLGIRSKTLITEKVLQSAPKLIAAGCFCIGTNQVHLKAAGLCGVPIFNAPYSNTRSVAELVIGAAIILIRKILPKNKAAHKGIWLKESAEAYELRGKKIGIIGYGNIGSQVGILAEALGMHVGYYDIHKKLPLGNAQAYNQLPELLGDADIVTIHTPEMPGGVPLLDATLISKIKKGACVINYARGTVVDLTALKQRYDDGQISGIALDVYPDEPEKNGATFYSPFINADNALLTPHIGGSTEEAQANIGQDVAYKLVSFLESGTSLGSCSIPELSLPTQSNTHRILHIHHNQPGVLSAINTALSEQDINIMGQYLKTNEQIGYVVLDVADALSTDAAQLLKQLPGTIKVRLLY